MAKQNIHFKIFYFDIVELSKKMYQKPNRKCPSLIY